MSTLQDANVKKRTIKSILIKTLQVFVSMIASALLSIVFSILYFFVFTSLFPLPNNNFGAGIYLLEGIMIPIAFFTTLGLSTGSITTALHNWIQIRKNRILTNSLIWFITLFLIIKFYYPFAELPLSLTLSALTLLEIMLVSSFTNWLMKQLRKSKAHHIL